MTGAEFRAQRTRAGVDVETVAAEAALPASTAAAWECGARLSYLKRRKLNHALWRLERDQALALPGAPACSVVSLRSPLPINDKAARYQLARHVEDCEDCQARGRYVSANVRPEPITGGLVLPLIGDVDRLLNWSVPERTDEVVRWSAVRANVSWGVVGGLAIGAGFCLMAALPLAFLLLLVLLTFISRWTGIATSFFVLETAELGFIFIFPAYLAAGAVAGAIVGLLRPLARWRLGAMLLAAIACTIFYWSMGPAAAALGDTDPLSREHLLLSLCLGSVAGGVLGFQVWQRPKSDSVGAEA